MCSCTASAVEWRMVVLAKIKTRPLNTFEKALIRHWQCNEWVCGDYGLLPERLCWLTYKNNFRPYSISQLAICIKYHSRKTWNTAKFMAKCSAKLWKFSPDSATVVLDSLFYLICSSIRYLSSPQNFLSFAVSIVQKVPSQPKLSRFNL